VAGHFSPTANEMVLCDPNRTGSVPVIGTDGERTVSSPEGLAARFRLALLGSVEGVGGMILASLFSLAVWLWGPDTKFSAAWVLLVISFLVVIVLAMTRAVVLAHAEHSDPFPRVKAGRSESGPDGLNTITLLVAPSPLLAVDSFGSVQYESDEGFQVLVAACYVETIRADRAIQVRIISVVPGQEAVVEKIGHNDAAVLRRLIISPSLPRVLFSPREAYLDK
jgi:hypothetical protein